MYNLGYYRLIVKYNVFMLKNDNIFKDMKIVFFI